MERWLILGKMSLIFYVILQSIPSHEHEISLVVFLLLMYICANLGASILKKAVFMQLCILISILLEVAGYVYASPLFILFLPLSILELLNRHVKQKWIRLLSVLVPVFYLSSELQALYLLIALFVFMLHSMGSQYAQKIRTDEITMDELRLTQQKLMQRIQEKDIYVKQSTYMLKLEERNRISQEIHDDIGHAITGALIQMEASKAMLKLDQDKAEELLQNAIGITKEGIESIRLTLKNMKPATEHVGISRLKLYIDEFAAKHSIGTVLTYHGNIDVILPIQWKVMAENINEALTNALKYSDANKITVDITVLNKLIKAEVKDNGKGAEKFEKGLGVIGMEERTASIDGKIIIDGKNGFSVTTLLPILMEGSY